MAEGPRTHEPAAHDHLDVIVVGAGLSGVAAGYYLQSKCPGKTYAILEARDAIGGTWDLFRYPGIRSDSDMYTLGYSFRPWVGDKAMADGPSILAYVRDTAREHGIDRQIRFGHRVVRASWSSDAQRWTVEAQRPDGSVVRLTCNFLFACSGYYDYAAGYTPDFPGTERFRGRIVHPQRWTEDVDYAGKRVVVIGSGATAVTLVPELAKKAAHVVMLQRSPTYVVALPGEDRVARALRRALPERPAYAVTRLKNVTMSMAFYNFCRRFPEQAKKMIAKGAKKELGPGFDVRTHFSPRYEPWDQRLCIAADGDLFDALRSGRASVVTDHVETFTEKGIALRSGEELEADLVVTATGLQLLLFGGAEMIVDGRPVEPGKTLMYKGTMLRDVPNFAIAVGYTNASWTLKCELTCRYVCRLLNEMDRKGARAVTPRLRGGESMEEGPLLDFSSGYVQRALDRVPRQGSKAPWRLYQNYLLDLVGLGYRPVDDGVLDFR